MAKPHPRGEALVKTTRCMGGYYKRPDFTAEKRDSDGFTAPATLWRSSAPTI